MVTDTGKIFPDYDETGNVLSFRLVQNVRSTHDLQ